MELRRGKTFIKSSLHVTHEKPPGAAAREEPAPRPVQPHSEQGPNKGAQPGPEEAASVPSKPVCKSRSDSGGPQAAGEAAAPGQLVGSRSFPGPRDSQRMIDYRHLVPQVPFVPAVAKTIPWKRISLKRPKKYLRDLFHLRRNKAEDLAALASPRGPLEAGGQLGSPFSPWSEDPLEGELLPDASVDLCRALCEDVASLKSFDSLTGCGEIFADESSAPSLELSAAPETGQGGAEQRGSPARQAGSDLARFWDGVNQSVRRQQRTLLGSWVGAPQAVDPAQPSLDAAGLAPLPLGPGRDPAGGSKASSVDTDTPKSEQPESVSTSDEGYCDAFSPGLEEDRKEAASPGAPAASFPRDSYSGDALYELFYDPSEGPAGPGLDEDLCVSESLSGPALGGPRSLCSFRVGAEENLAPAPGPDLLSQGLLQSSWKGKDCLLKLCDTELAITMGIISWLRRALPASAPGEPATLPRGPVEPLGAEKKGPGTPEGGGPQASAAVGSAPGGQELWAPSGAKGLLAGDTEVPAGAEQGTSSGSRDAPWKCVQVSGEEARRGGHEGLFSPVGPAASVTTDASSRNEGPDPSAWPPSQEPKPPGPGEGLQGPRRPGLGGSTPDAEPTLAGCAAQVAALHVHPDGQPPAQRPPWEDTGSGLCTQPRASGLDLLLQKPPNGFPGVAAPCGLPSVAPPIRGPQDARSPGLIWDLSQLGVPPPRLGAQARTSEKAQPLQLGSGAREPDLECPWP